MLGNSFVYFGGPVVLCYHFDIVPLHTSGKQRANEVSKETYGISLYPKGAIPMWHFPLRCCYSDGTPTCPSPPRASHRAFCSLYAIGIRFRGLRTLRRPGWRLEVRGAYYRPQLVRVDPISTKYRKSSVISLPSSQKEPLTFGLCQAPRVRC